MTLQAKQRLASYLDVQSFQDVGESAMQMRMIKSSEEHELYRKTARIADLGGFAVRDAIKEGVPEYEIALHGVQSMTREIARSFPDQEIRDIWNNQGWQGKSTGDPFIVRGGYRCRHTWIPTNPEWDI